MRRWLILAVVAGCSGPAVVDDDGTDEIADSDTGMVEVVCETLEVPGSITIPAGADVASGAIEIELVFSDLRDELAAGEVLASVEIDAPAPGNSGDFSLCAPNVPPPSDLYTVDPTEAPDMLAASYAIRARMGDGAWGGAALPDFLLWVEGTIPTEMADMGIVAGWNVLTANIIDGGMSSVALSEESSFDFDANLLYVEPPQFRGTLVPDLSGETDLALGLWNINRFVDGNLAQPPDSTLAVTPVTDASASAALSFGTLGEAPNIHTEVFDGLDYAEAAFYMILIWSDTEADADFNPGADLPLANSTTPTPAQNALFIQPTDWRAAVLPLSGLSIGWNLAEGEAAVDWSSGFVLDAP